MDKKEVVVITGASSGIGRACAEAFLADGSAVYSLSRHKRFDDVFHITCDVTDEQQVNAAFKEIYEKEGRIDVLVNNAGFGISGAVEFTGLAQAKKQLDVNFFGCFLCCRAVCGYMRKNGGGRIINISSMAAPLSIPFQAFYSASKSAVNSLTLALANELRPFNISVCAFMPGDVKTAFTSEREKETAGAEVYGEVIGNSIAQMEKDEQNGMSPEKIARAVHSLARKRNPKPLSTTGANYKLFAVLSKLLPVRTVNRIIGMIYSR